MVAKVKNLTFFYTLLHWSSSI